MRKPFALAAFILATFAAIVGAQAAPDPSGLWRTAHPREDWGDVLVQFYPLGGPPEAPRWDVSIWRETDSGLRKLRDGLFGEARFAEFAERDGVLAALWLGADGRELGTNRVADFEAGARLALDPDSAAGAGGEPVALAYSGGVRAAPAGLLPAPELSGVWSLDHPGTGRVSVRFSPLGEGAWLVDTVRELPGSGWALVREGIFGEQDYSGSVTRVTFERADGEWWLAWSDPDEPRASRRDRVATFYPDGSIGLGPSVGSGALFEVGRLSPLAGTAARFGTAPELLALGGFYAYRAAGSSDADAPVLYVERVGATADGSPLHRLNPALLRKGTTPTETPPSAFPHALVVPVSEEGLPVLRFIDPAGFVEELTAFDIAPDGSFSVRAFGLGEGIAAGRFERVARPEAARLPEGSAVGPAPPDEDPAPGCSREAAITFAKALWETLPRATRADWQAISGWNLTFTGGWKAGNLDPRGYAGPEAPASPGDDFAAFVAELALEPACLDARGRAGYRFPDRARFVAERCPGVVEAVRAAAGNPAGVPPPAAPPPAAPPGDAAASSAPPPVEPDPARLDPSTITGVELVVTSPSSASIASIAGHTLLLVRRAGDRPDGSDSLVYGFVGETARDRAAGVRGFLYAWRGITGSYRSTLSVETFADVAFRGVVMENRSVLRYPLALSRAEIGRLAERLDAQTRAWSGSYRFFGDNCASLLADALNAAFEPGGRVGLDEAVVAPMLVLSRLALAGRIGGVAQPEDRTLGENAREAAREIASLAERMGTLLAEDRRAVLEGILVRSLAGTLAEIRRDGLFREPFVARSSEGRGKAYGELAAFCVEGAGLGDAEHRELCELALRWVQAAFDRELFLAVPESVRSSWSKPEAIPREIGREILDDAGYRIRSRRQNSTEIAALRLASSRLRLQADSSWPDADFYGLARRVEEERDATRVLEGKDAYFGNAYYYREAAAGARVGAAGSAGFATWSTALYRGELGDDSACALKRELRLVLLASELRVETAPGLSPLAPEGAGLVARSSGTLLDLELIARPDAASRSAFLNPGFGLTLIESSSVLWDGERLFPGAEGPGRLAEARVILNLFEIADFRHYLNLAAGVAALSGTGDPGGAFLEGFALGVPLRIEAKFRVASEDGAALRISGEWLEALRGGLSRSSLAASVRLEWPLGRRTNAKLRLEASATASLGNPSRPDGLAGAELEFASGLSF
ncbi:MAG: DUF4105 domain-containing protein [Spirochaetales bacterium]|nr:DUF4105 domain-containing protein [Spirochaetales bacterium]